MQPRSNALRAVAALLLITCLAACGSDDDASRPTPTATAASQPTITATSVATVTATAPPPATATATPPPTRTVTASASFTASEAPSATATPTITPTATATVDTSIEPRYAGHGPYPVGYTTVDLEDRKVAVFYPAVPGSETGKSLATYAQDDPLPQFIRDLLTGHDLTFTMTAYADLPGATDGPFPVLLFSHGLGGWRLVNSRLLAGIASWGFVVAAPDHLERGLAALALGMTMPDEQKDIEVLLAARQQLAQPSGTAAAVLTGLADIDRTAVAGHSAGGGAALDMLVRPEVRAVVGYAAAGGPPELEEGKPTLLIAASGDLIVPPATNDELYGQLLPPRRALVIDRTGHNSFTDACVAIRGGTDLVGIAREIGLPIPEDLLALATNGCEAENLDPVVAFTVVQHFTVAHLRAAFGLDAPPVGLGNGIATAFDGITLTYKYEDINAETQRRGDVAE